MKTDAEILALIREELKHPAQLDGLPVTFGSFSHDEAVAIYRRAFRDGAEAAIKVIEEHRIPVGQSSAGEMAAEWTLDALREIREDIRRELLGTNQGAT
jgi:hypothetical protein